MAIHGKAWVLRDTLEQLLETAPTDMQCLVPGDSIPSEPGPQHPSHPHKLWKARPVTHLFMEARVHRSTVPSREVEATQVLMDW